MPRSKRLMTDDRSNVLVYLTGHGGNDFLKFQDAEDIGAWDLADAFGQMWEKQRYNELLLIVDTCQASSMYSKIFSPNIISVGSSQIEQSSYSNGSDDEIGVHLIDRFTSLNLKFLENVNKSSKLTLADLFDSYDPKQIESTPGIRTDLFPYRLDQVLITDFFGNIQKALMEDESLELEFDLQAYASEAMELHVSTQVNESESHSTTPDERFQQSEVPFAMQGTEPIPENYRKLLLLGVLGTVLTLLVGSQLN